MALSIKHTDADRLARELAARTGKSITEAVINALREQLRRQPANKGASRPLAEELMEIGRRYSALPVLDGRTPDEILGYDYYGLPR